MNISVHLITSIILTVILWPFIGLYSLWIIVGGYLIDVDHYFYTMFKLKTLSLKKAYDYRVAIRNDKKLVKVWGEIIDVFHTVEFWLFMIIMAIIAYFNNWVFVFYMFTITFLGMVLHLSLDMTDGIRKKRVTIRAVSIMSWINLMRKTNHLQKKP